MATEQTLTETQEGADVLQELMANADLAQAYRDPSIPEGTVLSETVGAAGEMVRFKKPSSMVRAGKTPLPERFAAYDKFGNLSMLPTAMMTAMLSKPRADSPNERAFHTHSRGITRDTCQICPKATEAYPETCEWCLKSSGGLVRKRFEDEDAKERHERAFHPDEKVAFTARMERAERQADREAQQRLAEAMLKMAEARAADAPEPAQMETPVKRPAKGGE